MSMSQAWIFDLSLSFYADGTREILTLILYGMACLLYRIHQPAIMSYVAPPSPI